MYVHMLMYSYINQEKERHLALFFRSTICRVGGRGAGARGGGRKWGVGVGAWCGVRGAEIFWGLFKSGKG